MLAPSSGLGHHAASHNPNFPFPKRDLSNELNPPARRLGRRNLFTRHVHGVRPGRRRRRRAASEPAAAPTATPAATASAGAGAAESGKIAWYGRKFAGRKTASGQAFNPEALTMAHKTLPFGTKVKITNPKNNKSVIVRVNDRGPTQADRIGDVSYCRRTQTRHGQFGRHRRRALGGHCRARQEAIAQAAADLQSRRPHPRQPTGTMT